MNGQTGFNFFICKIRIGETGEIPAVGNNIKGVACRLNHILWKYFVSYTSLLNCDLLLKC